MKRIIVSALVALTAFGGVAAADHGRRDTWRAQGGVTVTPSHGNWQQRPRYTTNRGYNRGYTTYNRGYYVARPSYRYVRRPIYVQRPVIRYRYTSYYQRPAVIVENYNAMPGYYWVAGQWTWNGYEWIWAPGHYEPDPQASGYYSNTYGSGYYENPYYSSDAPNYDSSYDSGYYDNSY